MVIPVSLESVFSSLVNGGPSNLDDNTEGLTGVGLFKESLHLTLVANNYWNTASVRERVREKRGEGGGSKKERVTKRQEKENYNDDGVSLTNYRGLL